MAPLLLATAIGLVVFPPLFRAGTMREALRLTFSAPAWLVPPVFTFVVAFGYAEWGAGVRENPFAQHGIPEGLVCAFLTTLGVAGQVGMLRAYVAGRPAGSADFALGMRDHTLALFAGKLLLMYASVAISYRFLGANSRDASHLLALVPNLLLAPLVGTCAREPRRLVGPILAALRAATKEPGLGRITLAQMLALAGIAWLVTGGSFRASTLAVQASTLSHSPFPMLCQWGGEPARFVLTLCATVLSSVCITAMFLRIVRGPESRAA